MARQKKDGKRPGVILFYDWHDALNVMSQQDGPAAVGNVVLALMNYAHYGEVPQGLTATEQMLFSIFRERTDAAEESYRQVCERNALNGAKGGDAKARNAKAALERTATQGFYSVVPAVVQGNAAIMGGAIKSDRGKDAEEWTVPIPLQSGGVAALTRADAAVYQSQFPNRDLHQEALDFADYLNAAGREEWPSNKDIAFEKWLLKPR